MRANAVMMLLAMLPAWWNTPSVAFAQSALERLERQIRQRVGAPESEAPDANRPPVVRPPETRRAGENAEPGYLGLVADDQKDRGRGVRILNVQRGAPAEKAGLRPADLITAVAGIRVRQMSDMSEIVDTFGPGQGLDFDILRDGKRQKARVVLGQRPAAAERRPDLPETVPLPPGEAISEPPEPQANDASRIERLERRVAELERRVAELERAIKTLKKE